MNRNLIVQQLAMLYVKQADLSKLTPKQVVKKYHRIVKQMKAEDKRLHQNSNQRADQHQVGFH